MEDKRKETKKTKIIALVLVLLINAFFSSYANAEVPQRLIYEARLLEPGTQDPKTTEHDFRFSFWSETVIEVGDVVSGLIDTGAANYAGWQEVTAVIPESNGYLVIELGNATPLPAIDATEHLYLQVEIKESGDPDTAYEILDTSQLNPLVDRASIGTVPYALSADTIDGAAVGIAEGNIVLLGPNDQFPISTIPGGTNEDNFVIDYDDSSATTVGLQFGNTLSKILSWDIVGSYFNFNDSVNIEGDLTLTGTVDGVDVSDLSATVTGLVNNGVTPIERSIILNSSYGGVVYVGDGTDNIGRLYLQNDETQDENYYEWTTSRDVLQDYDMIIEVPIPTNFIEWKDVNPWTFNYRTSTSDLNFAYLDIFVYDTNGDLVTLAGTSQDLASASWQQATLDFTGLPVFTPGETFKIVLKLNAKSEHTVDVGEIKFKFNG